MTTPFQELIQLITDGEQVNQQTINRVLRSLDGNARYVRDIFQAAMLGQTVFARSKTVAAEALLGQPVFYNNETETWEQAISATVESSGLVTLADSARPWGIIFIKFNDTLADILLLGVADVDLSAAIDGDIESGQYFLSGSEAGKLVKLMPPIGIPVLQVAGVGETAGTHRVFVRAGAFSDIFNRHTHYHFELVNIGAGIETFDVDTGIWTIESPDDEIEGWLPADHASFNGLAPAGALFGYNIARSSFASLWPPLPASGSYMEWNQGESVDRLGQGVPLGDDGLAIIDSNGIWWMSNCDGEVPWDPVDNDTTTTTEEP